MVVRVQTTQPDLYCGFPCEKQFLSQFNCTVVKPLESWTSDVKGRSPTTLNLMPQMLFQGTTEKYNPIKTNIFLDYYTS